MYIEDLIEGLNDYYKQGTFFSALKKNPGELKKQIISFLRKKGIEGFGYSYGKKMKYDELPKDSKEKGEIFRGVLKSFEVDKDFFSASKQVYSGFTFPDIRYKGKRFVINIRTNETFFEDGHDLTIKVIDKTDKYKSVDSRFKINLLNPINSVLEDLWSKIEKAEAKSPDEEEPKKSTINRRYSDDDVHKIVKNFLTYSFKELKSGKKSRQELPVEFSVSFESKSKEFSTDKKQQSPNFKLNFKVKKTSPSLIKKTGYSRFSKPSINPKILEKYPDIEKWTEILSQSSDRAASISLRDILNEKVLDDSHELVYERLQFAVKRFLKLGYYPDNFFNSYSTREPNSFLFKYSEDIKKRAASDLESLFKEKAKPILQKFFTGHFRLSNKFNLKQFLIKKLLSGKSL